MIDARFLDAIKRFEGFSPRAQWDYAQSSNGYGTRARHAGEVIDRVEAERRFKDEIKAAYDIVERFAPQLDEGTKAALTSLTFNAGPAWTRVGLGQAIRAGDLATAREIFQQYTKAGGQTLAGLATRRAAEAEWFEAGALGESARAHVAALQTTKPLVSAPLRPQPHADVGAISSPATSASVRGVEVAPDQSFLASAALVQERLNPAAFTLANLLSILSLRHIKAPDESNDDARRPSGLTLPT